jgi:hypothetical protein
MTNSFKKGIWAATALLASAAFSQENYTLWANNRPLQLNTTVSGANVAATQLKFPVLVRLGTADSMVFKQSIGKGADIRFAKTNGTRLQHHTELWDSVGRTAAIWVLVDSVKGNSTTFLNLYWGRSGAADSSKSTAVFDTTNAFRAVWNLSDSAGAVSKDATAMNTNAQWINAPALANGIIGKAVNFANPSGTSSANTKYLSAAYNVTNNNFKTNSTRGLTISAWVNRTNNNGGAEQGIAGRYNWNATPARRQAFISGTTTNWRLFRSIDGSNNEANFGKTPIVDGQWVHVVGTVRNGQQVLYINGAVDSIQTTATIGSLDSIWAGAPFLIGRMETNTCCSQSINGVIDEVRFSDTTRSADWVKLEYENQKPAQSLVSTVVPLVAPSNLTYPTQTAQYTVGTAITTNTPTVSGGVVDSFTIAPNLPAGLAISKTTGAISGTPTAFSAAANYVVTARNAMGTSRDTISIAVQLAPEDYSTWTYRRKVRLNTTSGAGGAALTANVYKFPVLIRLGQNERDVVTYSKGRGADLRVSKADGVTPLPYQIERWDSAGRKVEIWVLMDTVKANDSAQSIRLFWNKAGATDRSAGSAVFGTSNGYAAVWHQAPGTTGSTGDATSNLNNALWAGAATSTEGAIGPARLYNTSGAGDYDTVGANSTFDMSANDRVTVSAWVKRLGGNASGGAHEGIAGLFDWNRNGTGVANRSYDLVHNTGDGFTFHVSSTGGDGANEVIAVSGMPATDGVWTHVAGTVDGTNINVYVNGAPAIAAPYTGNIYFPATLPGMGPFTIGRMDDNGSLGQYFNGAIDEVQVSNVARSADWMKLSYANQKPVVTMVRHDSTNAPVVSLSAAARMASDAFNATKRGDGMLFSLPATGEAGKLALLDAAGRTVWSASVPAGATRFAWNGTSAAGSKLSSGLYTAQFVSNGQSYARRIVRMP